MWTETAASGKSHFRSTMLDKYIFYDIYSVKVIELNTVLQLLPKINCNWKVLINLTVTVTVTEKFH